MIAKGYDKWGYPIYESEWDDICHSWDIHDRHLTQRDLYYQYAIDIWLHNGEESHFEIQELVPTPFQPKPSRNIRAEKTRDYRKKRPKAMRYQPDYAARVALLFVLFSQGLQS